MPVNREDPRAPFLDVHRKHWPAWFGECEIHEIVFLAP